MSVFVGIVTCGRPGYFACVEAGVDRHLRDVTDAVVAAHDGPITEPRWRAAGLKTRVPLLAVRRKSVAHTKNYLMAMALEEGADWIFIGEDDVVPQSPQAVTGYIMAAECSGWEHLSFAHHGPANAAGAVDIDESGTVAYYPHYVGAWCLYSRRSLETCGLLDEHFVNSWDHVEHTLRLSLAGFHPLPPEPFELRAADAAGSEKWLSEIEGSIENTAIPHTEQWQADRALGRAYWRETYPESYYLVFHR